MNLTDTEKQQLRKGIYELISWQCGGGESYQYEVVDKLEALLLEKVASAKQETAKEIIPKVFDIVADLGVGVITFDRAQDRCVELKSHYVKEIREQVAQGKEEV